MQIILVYMFILINTYVEAYSAEEQEDYAVCFAELVEKGITTLREWRRSNGYLWNRLGND